MKILENVKPDFFSPLNIIQRLLRILRVLKRLVVDLGFETLCLRPYNEFLAMIVGNVSIDDGFADFVTEWNSSGGKELTESVNAAYRNR